MSEDDSVTQATEATSLTLLVAEQKWAADTSQHRQKSEAYLDNGSVI